VILIVAMMAIGHLVRLAVACLNAMVVMLYVSRGKRNAARACPDHKRQYKKADDMSRQSHTADIRKATI
jgi:hypothetical protein